jgi:recombination protein RecT
MNSTANEKTKQAMEAASSAKKAPSRVQLVCAQLSSEVSKQNFAMALPTHLRNNAERYVRSFMTQIGRTPGLANCTYPSLLGAMMTGTALGLDPSPELGEFYIIPYNNRSKGIVEAQFQLGYKGMEALAYRAGCKKIIAREVFENDKFEIEYGIDEKLTHKPPVKGDRGKVLGYYAIVVLPNDEKTFLYMTQEEVRTYGQKKSKTYGSGPWQTDFDAMAKKTCMKQLFKWMPKSTEVSYALAKDEGTVNLEPTVIKDSEDVLEAETIHEDDEPDVLEAMDKQEAKEIKEEKPLTNPDLFKLRSELLDLFGDGYLALNAADQKKLIQSVVDSTGDIDALSEKDLKKVIEVARVKAGLGK